eukprot:TRINITY_DN5238_c0_g3_i1.p1 TRINITY_DN5238_c0_g3~~TRINITY_DN5238_c0_g3_i1.p1  ORF type:complete len:1485 (-),score=207.57 TRINITY_DN5238_c0_g3_i1:123-4244(-)
MSGTGTDGAVMKVSSDGNTVAWKRVYGDPTGGMWKFSGVQAPNPLLIYEECWGAAPTSDGGAVVACGTGIEGCDPHSGALKTECEADPRTTWRSMLFKIDGFGDVIWSRLDNWNPDQSNDVATSASEYVFLMRDDKIVSVNDEGRGIGVLVLQPEGSTLAPSPSNSTPAPTQSAFCQCPEQYPYCMPDEQYCYQAETDMYSDTVCPGTCTSNGPISSAPTPFPSPWNDTNYPSPWNETSPLPWNETRDPAEELEYPQVYCGTDQIECYPQQYDNATGEPTYDIVQGRCYSQEEGCPCNEAWEKKCPGDNFTCWQKTAECPLNCGEQQVCYTNTYDTQGNRVSDEMQCASGGKCQCNDDWEEMCDDGGYSYCQEKAIGGCPLSCNSSEQVCFTPYFLSDGNEDFSRTPKQSCVPASQRCPCDPDFQERCLDEFGNDWCQTKADGACPLQCQAGQQKCYGTVYTPTGEEDFTNMNETCVSESGACPCNVLWERTCTQEATTWSEATTWCQPKDLQCPISCDGEVCIDSATGTQSCAPTTGCPCDSTQLTCLEWNYTMCYERTDFTQCPLFCDSAEKPMLCGTEGFDSSGGLITTNQSCMALSEDGFCPVSCDGATAKTCGAGADSWCIAKSESCPVTCPDTEQICYVNNYNAAGEWLNTTEECTALGMPCPCGTGEKQCRDEEAGFSWCDSSCPVTCDPGTEKACFLTHFTASGAENFSAQDTKICKKNSQPCPCGDNSKLCKWTDDYNISYEECFWNQESCPVTCNAGQQRCFIDNYNSSGYPISSREQCVTSDVVCPCGTNSMKCTDDLGHSYCMPLRDAWSGEKLSCPVYCKADEEMCDIVNYRVNGQVHDIKTTCVTQGSTCQCGANAMACVIHDGSYNWTDCIPRVGGYCPKQCPSSQVSCPEVADYHQNGSIIKYRVPSVQCAASYDQCGCGMQADMCRYGDGWGECVSREEGCPIACKAGERKCFVNDYKADGTFISDREVCVASNATCPCGQNSAMCPGETDACYPTTELKAFCPCKASEELCDIENFAMDGLVSSMSQVCVPKGQKCPCGTHARACPHPNDASQDECVPKSSKDGRAGCPAPCTPEQQVIQANGKPKYETCIQTNLDGTGAAVSKTITCVPYGTCQPGTGFKKCPNGAIVRVTKTCQNLYGNVNATAVDALTRKKSEMIITVNGVSASGTKTTAAMIGSELQAPASISVEVHVQAGISPTSRRLNTATSTVKVIFQNEGASTVSPEAVVTLAQAKFKSGELSSAMSSLGEVDTSKPPIVSNEQKTVVTRAAAALKKQEKVQTAAPAPTPTTAQTLLPSPAALPTPVPTPTGLPTPTGTQTTSPVPSPVPPSTADKAPVMATSTMLPMLLMTCILVF